ncbi:hypothetical protein RSPO_m00794 (plasmid) [Ralstonia solanacearum Po82]|uniref:Uncharacterized protein n=1 Tax=Ralstonia solanacearum (strain Po82) TaxID=1031711 RepID=F6G8Z2_RALS8|nr:hypothetical protein RSPO_m00794 [Ralstonia solanacearum Po82]
MRYPNSEVLRPDLAQIKISTNLTFCGRSQSVCRPSVIQHSRHG